MVAMRFKLQTNCRGVRGLVFPRFEVQSDPTEFPEGFSAAQVHEVGAQQERVPDAPPLGREQHEEEAHHEADHERHGVDDLPGHAGVVAQDDVVVRGGERHERDQRQRRVEQVRPPQPVPRRLPRPLPPPAAAAEGADARRRGHAVPEAARGRAEAVGEREEDAGGGAEGDEGPGQDAAQPGALAVVGEERGEDGEGEDGGGREEDVEARRAAQDEVEEHDEARVVVLVIVLLVLAWWISSVLARLLNEDLAFFLLRH